MSSHRFADWEAAPGWVVQRAGGQHGDEDVEQAVHDATYRARMTMPAGAQTFVVRATDRIMAGGGLAPMVRRVAQPRIDRKSTRLNSSHANKSYAVFCLKKKKQRAARAQYRRHVRS